MRRPTTKRSGPLGIESVVARMVLQVRRMRRRITRGIHGARGKTIMLEGLQPETWCEMLRM